MLKRFFGTLGVWTEPFLTRRSHSFEAESTDPGSLQATHHQHLAQTSCCGDCIPMPQMAIGSREQSSALLSRMYGILSFPDTTSE